MRQPSALPGTVALLLTLLFLAVLVRTAWVSDDALITWRSVLNLTHGFGPTFNVAERVQTFTHPLWMFALAALYLLTSDLHLATWVLSIGVSLAVFWLVLTRAGSAWQAVAAAVVLLGSRAFVDFSTSGLENPLSALLFVVFAGLFLAGPADPRRRLTALALVTSLLYLTRPDNVLIVLPALALAAWQTRRWTAVAAAFAVGGLPAVAWTAFSLVYYGFPFPNTAYAKLATGIAAGELGQQGIIYLIDSVDRDPLTLTAVAFAAIVGLARRRADSRALALGLVLALAYVVAIGGDFMAGRFVSLPLAAAVVLLTRAAAGGRGVWIGCAVLFGTIAAMSGRPPMFQDSGFAGPGIKANGIVDERAVYFKTQSLVLATRLTLRRPDWPSGGRPPARQFVVHTCGLMGVAGLDWGPFAHLLDECALADPLLARLPAVFNPDWRTAHFRRLVPDGYEESLATGENLIEDPALRAFYEDIRLITRAPLFSTGRWRAILDVNLGRSRRPVNVAYYRHHGSIVPLADMADPVADGTPWDAPEAHVLATPLAVRCEDRRGRRYLDVSLDSDDGYRLTFLRRGATMSTLDLGPIPPHRRRDGLVSYTVDVPPRARARGFDTVVIAPHGGEGPHAVGHLLLDGFEPTAGELLRRVAIRDGMARAR